MKMSNLFPGVFEVEHNKSFEVQNCHWVTFGEDLHSNCEQDDAIAHAVLNHDRLTEENAKLRKMLKYAVKVANDPNATYTAIEVLNIEAKQLLNQLKDQNNDK